MTNVETTEDREERLAKNEIIFRTVNEAIEQKAIEMGGLNEYQFICECSAATCFERISLTLRQYEHVRREGVRFFVTPGHENVEVEMVVGRTEHVFDRRKGRERRDRGRVRRPPGRRTRARVIA